MQCITIMCALFSKIQNLLQTDYFDHYYIYILADA